MSYAAGTTVNVERTIGELRRLAGRLGATSFGYEEAGDRGTCRFYLGDVAIRLMVPMPNPAERRFTHTPKTGMRRALTAARSEWEAEVRRRWRVLLLVVKAKIELIQVGGSTFEREFLADLVAPDGQTFGEKLVPELPRIFANRQLPSQAIQLLTDGRG